ncbi:hypothetical protein IKG68_00415 [Candidatus Saccharibacteria bacterium]|nr:hypothetical protein [Candidatus Saccharibacteria bacterium]
MVSLIVGFVVPLVYLLLFTASLVFLTKRSFGKCLPLTMMLSAFLLFFSQLLFGTFLVGFVAGIVFAFAAFIIVWVRRKEWNTLKRQYLTTGLIVFLVIYIVIFIYDFNRGYTVWDEFSHWGVMLKEMFRLDKFYSVDASNLMVHKDYPPIMQLFELFWMKLCGGYNEALALRALHTFELSLVVPFIVEKVAEKKNICKAILLGGAIAIATMLTVILFDQHGIIQSIYTDYVMALMVAYLTVMILISKKTDWFTVMTVMIGGGFLLLLKQMGLPLYLMVLCVFATLLIIRNRGKIRERAKATGLVKITLVVIALMVPFVLWFIWGRVTDGINQQFNVSSISLSEFAKILLGNGGEEWQRYTVKKYIAAVGQTSISTSWLPISYVQGVVWFVMLMWLVYRFYKNGLDKREVVATTAIAVLGAIGYMAVMLLLYVMSFGSYEGPILASFERYMGTYLIVMFVMVLMILVWQVTSGGKVGVIVVVAGCLALISAPAVYSRLYPELRNQSEANFGSYKEEVEQIRNVTGEDAKVFVLAQDKPGYYYYLQYFATPMKISNLNSSWPVDGSMNEKEFYETLIIPYVSDFDYMYIADVSEEWRKKYCEIVNFCPVEKGEIYEIKKSEDGRVQYEKVTSND